MTTPSQSPFRKDLLKGHTILITGGGTGLGRSMALAFAGLGASIAICGRRREVLEETAADIHKLGAPVFLETCDVRKPDDVERVVEGAFSALGGLTALINNAAGNFVCPTEALSPNAFNAVIGIVLNGTFHCTQAVAKKWIEQKMPGSVVNICTTYAWTGSAYVVPSVCAKAGVLAMTRSLAVEWGRYNIRLNAVAPGPFKTEGAWKNLMPPGFEQFLVDKNPMKRLGTHEELAMLIALLLSGAVNYINGECITIDGGEWLQGAGQFNGLLALSPEQLQSLKR